MDAEAHGNGVNGVARGIFNVGVRKGPFCTNSNSSKELFLMHHDGGKFLKKKVADRGTTFMSHHDGERPKKESTGWNFCFSKTLRVEVNNDGRRNVFWALLRKPKRVDSPANQNNSYDPPRVRPDDPAKWVPKNLIQKWVHATWVIGSDSTTHCNPTDTCFLRPAKLNAGSPVRASRRRTRRVHHCSDQDIKGRLSP